MNWASPAEFFAMGGYGLYVWGSTLACVVAVVAEVAAARRRRKDILVLLRRKYRPGRTQRTEGMT
jgi:heme exporter protein D